MNRLMRFFCLLLALMVLPAWAFAAVRMPVQRGTVTDDADVLSPQTATDLATYAERVKEETDFGLYAAVVHFLDGMDAQSYADALFARWELTDEDLLLVVAAGEDSFAAAAGEKVLRKLGTVSMENLMYTSSEFAALIRSQQYDAAFGAYCTALNGLLEREMGKGVRMDGLFGAQTAEKPVQIHASELWNDVMQAISDTSASHQEQRQERENQDNGLTAGGWIVLVILVMIVLRKNPVRRRARRGCGCSPLGWIASLLGLHALIDFFHDDH